MCNYNHDSKKARGTIIVLAAMLFLSLATFARQELSPNSSGNESPQIINVIAKSYAFIPSEIHVRKDAHVQLRLRTADRAHGLTIEPYPDGTRPDGHPGLVFDRPQAPAKVEHDEERIIEFVAVRAGTYEFKCSVQCGMLGHGRMKGRLIVDESQEAPQNSR